MADEGISVGSVSVTIVGDASSFASKLGPELEAALKPITERISQQVADAIQQGFADGGRTAAPAGAQAAGYFADSFKARLEAAFESLPKAEINADSSAADAKIQEIRAALEELSGKTVGVDISDDEALAKVEALKAELDEIGSRSPSIQVRVDIARASAELAAISAEADAVGAEDETVTVEADTAQATSNVGALLAAIVLIGPALVPIGAAAVGALAGIATAAAAGAAGLGVLALGLSSVEGVVKLLGTEQTDQAAASTQAATAATASARQQASAAASVVSATEALKNARVTAAQQAISSAESVANATQAEADAERTAADQVIAATEQVNAAKYAETQAAQQVTNALTAENLAREQAVRDLESYADAAVDANLSVTQSQLDLTTAQAAYQADLAAGTQNSLQGQQDALNLAKAQEALVEAQQQATNAAQDNAKAQQEGVNGAPGVVSATQAVAAAKHDQQTAEQSLTDAIRAQAQTQITTAESVEKAQQSLTDAVRAQANQQTESAYSVQSAENSLADAMRAQADAAQTAASSSQTALAKVQAQLASTNPAVLALAELVKNKLEPAFKSLQSTAADGLAPGITTALSNLAPLFSGVDSVVRVLAKDIGGLAVSASKALTDPFWTQFFSYVAATAGPTLEALAKILGNLATGFAGLIKAFAPVTTQIGQGLEDLTARFSKFGQTASNNSGFQAFIGYIEKEGPIVVTTLGKVFDAIGRLLEALAPIGDVILKGIGLLSDVIEKIPVPVLTVIAVGIMGIVAGLTALAIIGGVAAAFAALDVVLDGVAAAVGLVTLAFDPITLVIAAVAVAIYELVTHWRDAWGLIKDYVKINVDAIKLVIDGFILEFHLIEDAVSDVVSFIKDHWSLLVDILEGPIGLVVKFLADHWSQITSGAKDAVDGVVSFFSHLPGDILKALGDVGNLLYDAGKAIVQGLINGIEAVGDTVKNVVSSVAGDVKYAFTHPLSILSPSKVFEGYGVNIVEGLVGGIVGATPAAQRASAMLAQSVAGAFSVQIPTVTAASLLTPTGDMATLSYNGVTGSSGAFSPIGTQQIAVSAAPGPSGPASFTGTLHLADGALLGPVSGVLTQKVAAAQQLEDAGMPGSSLAHLANA